MEQTVLSINDDKMTTRGELIEYPAELIGGRNLIISKFLKNNIDINYNTGVELLSGSRTIITEYIPVKPNSNYVFRRPVNERNMGSRWYDENKNYLGGVNNGTAFVYNIKAPEDAFYFKFIDEANTLNEGYKLEKGTIPTDWTPAPEDLGLSCPDWVTEFKPSISENGVLAPEFDESGVLSFSINRTTAQEFIENPNL